MDKVADHLNYFITNHKDIYEAYSEYGRLIHEAGGPLDDKTRALIKIVVSSVSQHDYALNTHIKKAMAVGCNKEEIEHAILLTAPTVGFPNMMESLLVLRSFYEK